MTIDANDEKTNNYLTFYVNRKKIIEKNAEPHWTSVYYLRTIINPFVRWHRRWYRSKGVDPSPTVGVYYTPFNMALEPWAMGIGDHGCGKIFKQYRMCTHMMPSSHRYLCQHEKDDVRECMLAEKRILRHQFMYQHRVKKNLPFPEDPLIDGYNWPSFKYLN
ncbi:unnamed protein product [Adineta steineri]|uniref:Uncharacterized protein n=1 Tax=Adineta steineri TaxID=433720 RepID=A0A813SRB9_9BILA|nr:unnamed protein product [Adineta steineri]